MFNSTSRSENSLKNAIIGITCQILILFLSFASRTIFINLLGAEYLGINGLYTSMLSVLSLAELGIGNVMIYSLYKPVAKKDENEILGLLNYYRILYIKIALSIFALGIVAIPFLNKIVTTNDFSYTNLMLYYVLFLLNSVVSYFVAYKTALIKADQKSYILNSLNTIFTIVMNIMQIAILVFTKNYILYLGIQLIFTVLNNIYVSFKANRMYPFLKKKTSIFIIDKEKISSNIKAMFLYKIGVVIMNNTDNILISTIVGTVYVGYYSNYGLLIATITTFISIFINSIIPSIGNLHSEDNISKSYKFFNLLLLFFHWLSAFCSLSFLLVFNDFITIWLGKDYLLGTDIIYAIVFNFYIQNIINPVWIYRETMGLFNQIKFTMIYASIINLILSIVLGLYFGIAGIVISTALARLLTTVWYEPRLLYRLKFNQDLRNYWIRQCKFCFITIIATFIGLFLCKDLPITLTFILIKISIGFVIISVAFIITNYKSEEFIMLYNYLNILKEKYSNVYRKLKLR
jgi:O-antigen/teichoic acid export membrane protein